MQNEETFEGGCSCGEVRYSMARTPMYVHCCHCTWCRRASGAAFALNGMVEGASVHLIGGQTQNIDMPTASGRGQKITRCAKCHTALWGNFSSAGEAIHFIRIGTLDQAELFPPDVHIFTSTKLPWVVLGEGIPSHPEFYVKSDMWSSESIERYDSALRK